MRRLLAIAAMACVVLILPCVLFAASPADGRAPLSLHEGDSFPPPSDDDDAKAAGGQGGVKGDPDELGGGFRVSGTPPSDDKGIGPVPGKPIVPLVWLFIRLL